MTRMTRMTMRCWRPSLINYSLSSPFNQRPFTFLIPFLITLHSIYSSSSLWRHTLLFKITKSVINRVDFGFETTNIRNNRTESLVQPLALYLYNQHTVCGWRQTANSSRSSNNRVNQNPNETRFFSPHKTPLTQQLHWDWLAVQESLIHSSADAPCRQQCIPLHKVGITVILLIQFVTTWRETETALFKLFYPLKAPL